MRLPSLPMDGSPLDHGFDVLHYLRKARGRTRVNQGT